MAHPDLEYPRIGKLADCDPAKMSYVGPIVFALCGWMLLMSRSAAAGYDGEPDPKITGPVATVDEIALNTARARCP